MGINCSNCKSATQQLQKQEDQKEQIFEREHRSELFLDNNLFNVGITSNSNINEFHPLKAYNNSPWMPLSLAQIPIRKSSSVGSSPNIDLTIKTQKIIIENIPSICLNADNNIGGSLSPTKKRPKQFDELIKSRDIYKEMRRLRQQQQFQQGTVLLKNLQRHSLQAQQIKKPKTSKSRDQKVKSQSQLSPVVHDRKNKQKKEDLTPKEDRKHKIPAKQKVFSMNNILDDIQVHSFHSDLSSKHNSKKNVSLIPISESRRQVITNKQQIDSFKNLFL